jgi:hypothetical protein
MRGRAIPVAVLLLAVLGGGLLFLWLAHDPLESARHRVPLGADEAAVIAAVGREPDDSFGRLNRSGEPTGRVLYWEDGDGYLFVDFGEDGRAATTEIRRDDPTLWERVRAWWPW